ncbi:MAG: chemotaxis protein CheW [bacterium]
MEETYLNSHKELLDREFTPELQEIWSAEVAEKVTNIELKTLSFVVFKLGGEWFGLDVDCFRDVVSPRLVHSIPGRKTEFLEGVVNIEGELMMKVNPNSILGLTQNPESAKIGKFMLLEHEGDSFVIKADEFAGVEKLSSNQIVKAPALNNIEFHQAISELTKTHIEYTDIHEQFAVNKSAESEETNAEVEKNTVILGIYKRQQNLQNKLTIEETDADLTVSEMTIGIIWERRFFELLKSNFKW